MKKIFEIAEKSFFFYSKLILAKYLERTYLLTLLTNIFIALVNIKKYQLSNKRKPIFIKKNVTKVIGDSMHKIEFNIFKSSL